VVLLPMILELGSSALLAFRPATGSSSMLARVGLVAAAATWLSTISLQIPSHRRLARGFDPGTHRGLLATNLLRTACWTAHSAIMLLMVARRVD
jgi:hypothetical protein